MAKKEKKGGYKQDTSIVKRRKQFMEQTIGEAVIVGLFGIYAAGSFMAYKFNNPMVKGLDKVGSNLLDCIVENPIYMFATMFEHPESIMTIFGGGLLIAFLLELLVLISYYFNRSRIHNDVDTLKGSTEWEEVNYILEKYAEVDEEFVKKK